MRDLGRYVAHHALGRGGTATVYFGTFTGPSGFVRRVAIKELHAIIASDPQLRSMLTEEARISGRIMHPNTVPVLDMVEHDGQAFAVMDYVHGATVFELLRAARARRGNGTWSSVFPLGVAMAIGADVLSGLAAAHAAKDVSGTSLGVIHRDISPDNMLVGMDGVSRLTDFGIARAEGRAVKTESGVVKGKFRYMAPEQAAGEATQSSDLFSMGVVLFELLTGSRLFDAEHEAAILNQVLGKAIATVASVNAEVPVALSDVVARALSRDAARRFPSAAAMGEAWRAATPRFDQEKVQAFVTDLVGESLREKLALVERAERAAEARGAGPCAAGAAAASWDDAPTEKDAPRTRVESRAAGTPTGARARHDALAAQVSRDAPFEIAEPTRLTFEAEPVVRRGLPIRLAAGLGVPLVLALGLIVYDVSRSGDTTGSTSPNVRVDRDREHAVPSAPTVFPSALSTGAPSASSSAVAASSVAAASASATKVVKQRTGGDPDCRTPFYIDNQGVRVYRRECLQ